MDSRSEKENKRSAEARPSYLLRNERTAPLRLKMDQVEHESIAWIQKKFLSTYEALSDKMKARYDPKDVDRVRNDPEYVASFVLAKSMQRSEAFAMLERCLRWRKQFVSTLTRGIVDDDVLGANALFFLGRDRDGRPIATLRMARHHKGDSKRLASMKALTILLIEEQLQALRARGEPEEISIVVDMEACGPANIDVEFFRFLVDVFRDYYPGVLGLMLLLEKPWFTSGLWDLVRHWLSDLELEAFAQVSIDELDTYIDVNNRLDHHKGHLKAPECNAEIPKSPRPAEKSFSQAEEHFGSPREPNKMPSRKLPSAPDAPPPLPQLRSEKMSARAQARRSFSKQKVAEWSKTLSSGPPSEMWMDVESVATMDEADEVGLYDFDSFRLFKLNPEWEVVFAGELEKDIVQTVAITNTCDTDILYRVRTTSSDRYRVKPKLTVIKRGDSVNITIHRKPVTEEQLQQRRKDDKFKFIACRALPDVAPTLVSREDMERFWGTVDPGSFYEQILTARNDTWGHMHESSVSLGRDLNSTHGSDAIPSPLSTMATSTPKQQLEQQQQQPPQQQQQPHIGAEVSNSPGSRHNSPAVSTSPATPREGHVTHTEDADTPSHHRSPATATNGSPSAGGVRTSPRALQMVANRRKQMQQERQGHSVHAGGEQDAAEPQQTNTTTTTGVDGDAQKQEAPAAVKTEEEQEQEEEEAGEEMEENREQADGEEKEEEEEEAGVSDGEPEEGLDFEEDRDEEENPVPTPLLRNNGKSGNRSVSFATEEEEDDDDDQEEEEEEEAASEGSRNSHNDGERRRIQAHIRLRQLREQRETNYYNLFTSGHINLSHFLVTATIMIAVSYLTAAFFFESDIVMMPNSSKRFRGLDLERVFDVENETLSNATDALHSEDVIPDDTIPPPANTSPPPQQPNAPPSYQTRTRAPEATEPARKHVKRTHAPPPLPTAPSAGSDNGQVPIEEEQGHERAQHSPRQSWQQPPPQQPPRQPDVVVREGEQDEEEEAEEIVSFTATAQQYQRQRRQQQRAAPLDVEDEAVLHSFPTARKDARGQRTASGGPARAPFKLLTAFPQRGLDPAAWEVANWANGSPYACPFEARKVVAGRGRNLELSVGPSTHSHYACGAGEARTRDFWGYGCYRAVVRPGRTPGVVSSLQAFSGALDNGGNGLHNEISLQFRGTDTTQAYLIIWTNGELAGQHVVNLGFDATYEFHTYGLLWTDEGVDFVVDGRLVWRRPSAARTSARQVATPAVEDARLKAILNTWAVDASAERVAGSYQGQASLTEVAAFSFSPDLAACSRVL